MSSVRTRTAQKIREALSSKNITRDPEFESIFQECVETEELLRQVVTYSQYFQKTLPALAYFSEGISSSVLKLYDKTTAHRGPALQISEVHQSCHAVFKETEEEFKGLMDHMSQWFKIFDDIRDVTKQRNKSRLIYDHYVQKLNSLKASIAKKRSKNPNYHETPKEAERIARNERKLQSATSNFQSDTIKSRQLISQALEIKFSHLSPALAKVRNIQIMSIEVSLFKRVQKTVSTLKHVPEMLTKANRDRSAEQSMKRKSIEKQHYKENDTDELGYEEELYKMKSEPVKQESSNSEDEVEARAHKASVSSWEHMAKKVNDKDSVWGMGNPNMFMAGNPAGFDKQDRSSIGSDFGMSKKQFETDNFQYRDTRGISTEVGRDNRAISTDGFGFGFQGNFEESKLNEGGMYTSFNTGFKLPENRSSNEASFKPQTDEYGFQIPSAAKDSSFEFQSRSTKPNPDEFGFQDSYGGRSSLNKPEPVKEYYREPERSSSPDSYTRPSSKSQIQASPPAMNPSYLNTGAGMNPYMSMQAPMPSESFQTAPPDAAMAWNPALQQEMMQQYMQSMMNPQYLQQMQQNMMSYQNIMAVQFDEKDPFKGLGFVEEEQKRQQMEAQMKAKMAEQQKQQPAQGKTNNPFKGNNLLDMM